MYQLSPTTESPVSVAVAVVWANGALGLWQGLDDPQLGGLSTAANATTVAWDPDGLLLVGRGDGSISAVDPVDLTRVLWTLAGHNAAPDNLEVSADGQILVSSTPTESKVWDLANLQLLVELPSTSRARLASADGLRVHTSGAAGASPLIAPAGTWDLRNDTVAKAACRLAGRHLTQAEWDQYLPTDEPYDPACVDGK